MSSAVESEIVSMKFDNTQFEQAATTSMTTLGKLKALIETGFTGGGLAAFGSSATKSLTDVQTAARNVDLSPMAHATHGISASFIAMSTVAITAISSITSAALHSAADVAKSLTIAPVTTGLEEYEHTLNSTQTLMSGTGESVEQVTATLKELNDFSDRTIYSFRDMTQNITMFTNAGMASKPAADVMKGIANAAASAGISASQAAAAMRGFGQSMSMGYVGLMDWNQVDNSQLATKEFKNELIKSAVAAGTLTRNLDGTTTTAKGTEVTFQNLRSTLHEQWLTSEALTDTLARYSDTSTVVGKKAAENATRVKTLSQLMGVLRESAQSGWAETWLHIFGNLEQASRLWTNVNDVVGGFIQTNAQARTEVIKDWKELGGRTALIFAVRHAFEALMSVVKPIHEAFREIFPPKTGEELRAMTKTVNKFFKHLALGEDSMEGLKNTFKGLFALLHIALSIVSGLARYVFDFFAILGGGGGSVLELTGSIGLLLVKLDEWLTKGDFINRFFTAIINGRRVVLEPIIDVIGAILGAFKALITGGPDAFRDALGNVGDTAKAAWETIKNAIGNGLSSLGDLVGQAMDSAEGYLDTAINNLVAVFDPMIEKATGVKDVLGNAFSDMGTVFEPLIDKIGQVKNLLGGLFGEAGSNAAAGASGVGGAVKSLTDIEKTAGRVEAAWNRLKAIFGAIKTFFAPAVRAIKDAFSGVGEGMSNFAKGLDFQEVLALINTGFIIMIYRSFNGLIDNLKDMAKSGRKVLDQVTSNLKTMQAEVRADIIFKIAGALAILAVALLLLSTIEPARLATALGGMTAMLVGLVYAMKALEAMATAEGATTAGAGRIILYSIAIGILAVAMMALALAVKIFSTMSLGELIKGLIGVGVGMKIMVAAINSMAGKGTGGQMLAAALAIGIISVALLLFAKAVKVFADMDWGTMLDGTAKIAILIAALNVAMRGAQGSVAGAAALVIVSGAMFVLAKALVAMNAVDWSTIPKLALSLGMLVIAINLMSSATMGALAMLIVSAGMVMLANALTTLNGVDWGSIVKMGVILTGLFLILGIAGVVLAPIVPVLLALGITLQLLGLAMLTAGMGMALFATALAGLAVSGAAGFAVLIAGATAFMQLLPILAQQFGLAIVALAQVLGENVPVFVKAMAKLVGAMLDQVPILAPKFGRALMTMIRVGLAVLRGVWPDLIQTGIQMIIQLLAGLATAQPKLVAKAVELMVAFIREISNKSEKLTDAAFKAIIKFMDGLSVAIDANSAELGRAGGRLAVAIGNGIVDGVWAFASQVGTAIRGMIDNAIGNIDVGGMIKGALTRGRGDVPEPLTGSFLKLIGGSDQVKEALGSINGQIEAALNKAEGDINKWKAKVKELEKSGKDPKALKKARKELKEAQQLKKNAEAAEEAYKRNMKKRGDALRGLAKEMDQIKKKIADAEVSLQTAIDKQTAFKDSVMSTFGKPVDIGAGQTLASYMRQVERERAKVEKFKATLTALRAAGLDDESYRRLLEEGVDAQRLMDQLLAGGEPAITAFENANQGLTAAAQGLADTASSQLGYDAAVLQAQNFLQGIIDGVGDAKSLAEIEKAMRKIAKLMMKAIRKELAIKSPSRKAAEIAKFFILGMTRKMHSMNRDVERASSEIGKTALDTLQASMSRVGDKLDGRTNINPVITPVLDLAQLTKKANQISSLLAVDPIVASVSFDQASAISAGRAMNADGEGSDSSDQVIGDIRIEQNNYSPKALDPVDIYRANKSAIALAKEALGV